MLGKFVSSFIDDVERGLEVVVDEEDEEDEEEEEEEEDGKPTT
jgi:hypothetical protein